MGKLDETFSNLSKSVFHVIYFMLIMLGIFQGIFLQVTSLHK